MSEISNHCKVVSDDTVVESKIGVLVTIVIPVYNNASTIAGVISGVQTYCKNIVVVDDGSTDDTFSVCSKIDGIILLRHDINRGKGAALRTAFGYALRHNFTHAITVDADGQHLAKDIPLFLQKVEDEPGTLWIGDRIIPVVGGIDQPPRSRFGRHFGAFWYKVYTGNPIRDTQSGFRAYPVSAIENLGCDSDRYEYEIEILICAAWNKIPVKSVPIHLLYQPKEERVSHFRPIRDFMRISVVNGRAAITRLFFPPQLINVPGLHIRKKLLFVIKKELTSNATPFKAALSFGVGVTIAVTPFHGFQVVMLLAIAFIFKLNRPLALLGVSVSSAPAIPFWIAAGLGLGKLIVPMDTAIYIADTLEKILPSAVLDFLQNKMVSGFLHGFIQWFLGTLVLAPLTGIIAFFVTWPMFKTLRKVREMRKEKVG
jgi:glycosyltransferase involved in cell wall biosynthesis